jgi:Protein of unknown function (DUF3990)
MIFHGGAIEMNLPEIIKGRYAKDFGVGFYCTEMKEQAIRWAKRFNSPVVSIYDYKPNAKLKELSFLDMSEPWLDFIISCRNGNVHDYDVVSGPMANDQIYNYISDYIAGILTKEQFWILAKFKHPTHQICFCTENALTCLIFIKSENYDR